MNRGKPKDTKLETEAKRRDADSRFHLWRTWTEGSLKTQHWQTDADRRDAYQ
jgi:hypothetical protein